MKKSVLILITALLLTGCSTANVSEETVPAETAVSETYENQIIITNPLEMNLLDESPDMSGYVWLAHPEVFQQISFDESLRFLDNGGTGMLFYGAEWCAFCQRAIVELGNQASEAGVTIYYVSLTDRDATMEQVTTLANKLDWMKWVKDSNGADVPNFEIPEVIAVKDGVIQGHHLSLLDDFKITDANSQMNADQKKVLRAIYNELFLSIAD